MHAMYYQKATFSNLFSNVNVRTVFLGYYHRIISSKAMRYTPQTGTRALAIRYIPTYVDTYN